MTARSTSNLTPEEREILNRAPRKGNAPQLPSDRPAASVHADRSAVRGSAVNAIAKVKNQSSDRLHNVEHKIEQLAQQRQEKLEEYASAIAYLTDGDAFIAELAVLVEQKLQGDHAATDTQKPVETTAITLDSLDPYSQRSFEFRGKFFSGSAVGLLGGG